jgi:hypothetical protein
VTAGSWGAASAQVGWTALASRMSCGARSCSRSSSCWLSRGLREGARRLAIVALLDLTRRTPARSVVNGTVGLELTAADDERQDGSGLSVAWLGGGVASGSAGAVAVSPLARVRIARTVACAICAAVAMLRWRVRAGWRGRSPGGGRARPRAGGGRPVRRGRAARVRAQSGHAAVRAVRLGRRWRWGVPRRLLQWLDTSARAWASGPAVERRSNDSGHASANRCSPGSPGQQPRG